MTDTTSTLGLEFQIKSDRVRACSNFSLRARRDPADADLTRLVIARGNFNEAADVDARAALPLALPPEPKEPQMSKGILALAAALLICASTQFAFADESGTVGGAVGGAAVGAAVGGPVGAIVGGVGGAAIGNSMTNHRYYRHHYYVYHPYHHHHYYYEQ